MILGLGVDLVFVPDFARQLEVPGTRFLEVFTGAERRAVERRVADRRVDSGGSAADHYAARWAAKEAFIKAWSVAIAGQAPPIAPSDVVWQEIEVYSDAWSRPLLRLHGAVAREVTRTLGPISGSTGQKSGPADPKSGSTGQKPGPAEPNSGPADQESGSEFEIRIHLSMSHDGDAATATVIIEQV